jgi:hypothetical protein
VEFDFDIAGKGRTFIRTTEAFYDLGPSMADSPVVKTVHQFRTNGLVNVTAEYCRQIIDDSSEALSVSARRESRTESGDAFVLEQTRLTALSAVLQEIHCGDASSALRLVQEVWPPSEQSRVRLLIRKTVESRWPDIAKKMTGWN